MYTQSLEQLATYTLRKGFTMGYTKAQQDGKGTSKGKSPEVMNAERRAKKARQNADARARKGANVGVDQTLFDGVRQDRQERHEQMKEARRASAAQAQERHEHQAAMALASPAVTSLPEGSTARTFAEAIIVAFVDARPYDGKSKTAVAVEQATNLLGEAWLKQSKKSADMGRSAAYRALKGAHIKMTTPATV